MCWFFNRKSSYMILLITAVIATSINCIPTSILADEKETNDGKTEANNNKETNNELDNNNQDEAKSSSPQKRGVNPLLFPDSERKIHFSSNSLPGIWDELGNPALFPEIVNRNYDLDNPESYKPFSIPLDQYQPDYFGYDERKKRSMSHSHKSKASRLKRASKVSPADMLSLLALMEARQEAQQLQYPFVDYYPSVGESPNDVLYSPNAMYPELSYPEPLARLPIDDQSNGEWLNTWAQPSVEYFGLSPMEIDQVYNVKYPKLNLSAHKRFMVSKKKREIKDDCKNSKIGEFACLMRKYESETRKLMP